MARRWDGTYTREEFEELDGELQARIIALWTIDLQVEAIIALEHTKQIKAASQG